MTSINHTNSTGQVVQVWYDIASGDFRSWLWDGTAWTRILNLSGTYSYQDVFYRPGEIDDPDFEQIWPDIMVTGRHANRLSIPLKRNVPFLPNDTAGLDLAVALCHIRSDQPDQDPFFAPFWTLWLFNRPDCWPATYYAKWTALELTDRITDPQESTQGPQLQTPHLYVVPQPEKPTRKYAKRHPLPNDLDAYISAREHRASVIVAYRAMYRDMKPLSYGYLQHYTGKRSGWGFFYVKGSDHLEQVTAYSARSIAYAIHTLKVPDHATLDAVRKGLLPRSVLDEYHWLIRIRHQGFHGEGFSIIELAKNMRHVYAWKRELTREG